MLGTGTDETDVTGSRRRLHDAVAEPAVGGHRQLAGDYHLRRREYTNDYSELYSQSTGTWTVGPTFAGGFSPTNGAASAVLP